jgi:hypothetical protein
MTGHHIANTVLAGGDDIGLRQVAQKGFVHLTEFSLNCNGGG